MAATPKKLYGGTLTTTTTATLYTASGVTAVVTSITVNNKSGSSANLTLTIDGTALFTATPVPAGATWTLGPTDIRQAIPASGTITGGASAGSALDVRISGVEL